MGDAIGADNVKRQLIGIVPILEGALGADDLEALYEETISQVEEDFQRTCQHRLKKTVIKMWPEDGVTYDLEEDPLNYQTNMLDKFTLPSWVMRQRPILSVERMRLCFQKNAVIITIPREWQRINHQMGRINIMPYGVPVDIASGVAAWYVPLLNAQFPWNILPEFVCVDYTAGYEDPKTDPALAHVRLHLARAAALSILVATRRLLVSSVQLDGFTQGYEDPGRTIEALEKQTQQFVAQFQRTNRPPLMRVI